MSTPAPKPPEKRISIANCRGDERTADILVYCGRGEAPPGLSNARLGNPFGANEYGRASAINRFEGRLFRLPPDSFEWRVIRRLAQRLNEGKTVQLFCWCRPRPCHCTVIRNEILKTVKVLNGEILL